MKPEVIVKLNKYNPDEYVYPFEVVVRIIEKGNITTFNKFCELLPLTQGASCFTVPKGTPTGYPPRPEGSFYITFSRKVFILIASHLHAFAWRLLGDRVKTEREAKDFMKSLLEGGLDE